jgi:alpha-L-fucosidase
MSPREAIHLLVDIVAKGGNLLLNVAPGPDGTWQQGAYDLLAAIGAWMKVNGEAIYGTRAIAPYAEGRVRMTRQRTAARSSVLVGGGGHGMPREIRVASHGLRTAPRSRSSARARSCRGKPKATASS